MTHKPEEIETMARLLCEVEYKFPDDIGPLGRLWNEFELQADAALDVMQAKGWKITDKIAKRPQTILAEQMGAGEAWAEDCWLAMHDAAPIVPGGDRDE